MTTFNYSGDIKETRSFEFNNSEIEAFPAEVDEKVQEIYDEAVKNFEKTGTIVLEHQEVFIDTQRKSPVDYPLYQRDEYYNLLKRRVSKIYHIFRIKEADSSLEH